MNNVRPHLTMLTEEQKQDIHRYTLKLLATTGVRVDLPSARGNAQEKSGRTRTSTEELCEFQLS